MDERLTFYEEQIELYSHKLKECEDGYNFMNQIIIKENVLDLLKNTHLKHIPKLVDDAINVLSDEFHVIQIDTFDQRIDLKFEVKEIIKTDNLYRYIINVKNIDHIELTFVDDKVDFYVRYRDEKNYMTHGEIEYNMTKPEALRLIKNVGFYRVTFQGDNNLYGIDELKEMIGG